MTEMAEFLVELYAARDDHETAWQAAVAARHAAAELTREGCPVRCVRFVFVPEDETCLLLAEAPSAEAVREALARAGLESDHISAAATYDTHPSERFTMPTTQHVSDTTASSPLTQLKAKQHQVWSSGDYRKVAWITVPLARELITAVDLRPGARVLDVACGTGHAAIEAARSFADVTGIDYVPALVETARRRADAEGLLADFREADAENLPFADDTFDVVLSAIGVMFTADHDRAAAELVRVARPGGRIGLASWTPAGFIGHLLRIVSAHVPPPPVAKPPTRWGAEEGVAELLEGRVTNLSTRTRSVTQRFLSEEHFADFMLTHYGPTHVAASRLDDTGRAALRDDIVALARRYNHATDGTFVSDWEYLVVTATAA